MDKVVVDTNVVFAAIHSATSSSRQKLLILNKHFITSRFLFVEIFRHKERIFKRSRANEEEIYEYLERILHRLDFYNEELVSVDSYFRAYHLCKDIDLKDLVFVALSVELDAPLWTRDTVLKEGLRTKGFTNFFDEDT